MGKISTVLKKSGEQVSLKPGRTTGSGKDPSVTEAKSASPVSEAPIHAAGTADKPLPAAARAQREATFDSHIVAHSHRHSFAAEQFKLLKTHLLFGTDPAPPRVTMVVSALPGEGKSFVSANLSVSIAQNLKERVLLIDCDLRRPGLNKFFNIHGAAGLSEYLQDGDDVSRYLIRSPQDKLTLLLAGRPPANPLELLSSDKMYALLKEVRERYADRYIVLDSPPPQLTAESNALARQADGLLLVVKRGAASREIVVDLVDRLGQEKFIGVVYNHFVLPKLSAFGYGKYGKYSKYYY